MPFRGHSGRGTNETIPKTPKSQYTHIQLDHLLKTNSQVLTYLPEAITRYYKNTTTSTKGISIVYTCLLNKNICEKNQAIWAWEWDIRVEYPTKHWEKTFRLTYSSAKGSNLWEMQQKIILCWYLTPYRISKIYPGASPLLLRNCGGVGTLYHVLWSCPRLRLLWSQTGRLLSNITNTQQTLTPDMAILSLELHNISSSYRTVTSHILLASRLTILRHWKSPITPNVMEVISTYETLHTSASGNYAKTAQDWRPWLDWYNKGATVY